MSKRYLIGALLIVVILLAACKAEPGPEGPVGPAGPAGPMGPQGPTGDDAVISRQYVGSEKCGNCHEEQYAEFILSGHPYKLTKVENGERPRYPYDAITGGVKNPPEGYTWDDITYVIGGYGWKARFMDKDGYIITGDENATTQYNFANRTVGNQAGWVAYHAGEQKAYTCGTCHTTGYNPDGHQDGLEGIIGTWAAPGVQCEACHGPGSLHAEDPYGIEMNVEYASQLCGECHVRDNPAEIDASGGFEKHHEQYEDLYNSKHFAISCVTCHDPHASALYSDDEVNPNKGIVQQCESCHWENAAVQNNEKHENLACTDCHMPPLGKSAQANLDIFTGDVHSHQFAINTDPDAPQFYDDGAKVMPYLTLSYACQHCHNGEVNAVKELDELAADAKGYHTEILPTAEPVAPEATATPTP